MWEPGDNPKLPDSGGAGSRGGDWCRVRSHILMAVSQKQTSVLLV